MIDLGWLSPHGELTECEVMDHVAVARELVETYKYEAESYRWDDALMAAGWVHITRSLLMGQFMIYWSRALTEEQKNYLRKNVFIPENKERIQNWNWYEWECEEEGWNLY